MLAASTLTRLRASSVTSPSAVTEAASVTTVLVSAVTIALERESEILKNVPTSTALTYTSLSLLSEAPAPASIRASPSSIRRVSAMASANASGT